MALVLSQVQSHANPTTRRDDLSLVVILIHQGAEFASKLSNNKHANIRQTNNLYRQTLERAGPQINLQNIQRESKNVKLGLPAIQSNSRPQFFLSNSSVSRSQARHAATWHQIGSSPTLCNHKSLLPPLTTAPTPPNPMRIQTLKTHNQTKHPPKPPN